jgi:predicted Zn-dependent protease
MDMGKALDMTVTVIQETSKAFRPISDEEEYYVGRAVSARLFHTYPLSENKKLTNYINLVGKTISLQSEKPFTFGGYHFALLDTNEINAFACPGGIILITKGMIQLAHNEDELAAIIAHEIAHINHRDGIASIKQARWTEALTIIGVKAINHYASEDLARLVNIFEDSIDDIIKTLVVNGYSKTQEYAADEKALSYLTKAGYDPNALINFIDRLSNYSKNSYAGIINTHPDAKERIKNLKEKIQPTSLDISAFKKRKQRFQNFFKS